MSVQQSSPEIGLSIEAGGYLTNYHDQGEGFPLLLIHGSGPGVTAWANWRMAIPELAKSRRVIAPDMLGFGYSARPAEPVYSRQLWVDHTVALLDALGVEQTDIVGNSFGGALALALAIEHPQRVRRLVLMGSVGVSFPLTEGLDMAWGYEPSFDNMRKLMDVFAHDRALVTDELAELRYQASIRPGFQESFSAMFPAPRQRWIDSLASGLDDIRQLPHQVLVVHGREDRIIPLQVSVELSSLIQRAQLHVFGECGHWTQIEHAARFHQLVDNFLSEADVASGA